MRLATGSIRRSRRSRSDSSMSSGARLGKPRRVCRELAGGFGLGVVPHQSASLLVARFAERSKEMGSSATARRVHQNSAAAFGRGGTTYRLLLVGHADQQGRYAMAGP